MLKSLSPSAKVVCHIRKLSDLLHYSTTVHLLRQAEDMVSHLICQDLLLRLIAVLEELLNYIIAKYISHQLDSVGIKLAEDLILFVTVGSLQFLLNEA